MYCFFSDRDLQSKARQLIEQAWGQLVKRFALWSRPSLWRGKHWKERMALAILTSMILHNMCINGGDGRWDANEELPVAPYFEEQQLNAFDGQVTGQQLALLRMYVATYVSQKWKLNGNKAVRK